MIIGLDLSINSTGVCIRDEERVEYFIIVPKLSKRMKAINDMKSCSISHITYDKIKDNVSHNIRCISEKICDIIKDFGVDKIDGVVIEDVALRAKGRSIIDLTLLNGYVRCMLDGLGVEYKTMPPTAWKKVMIGNGMADKELIIYCWAGLDPDNCRHMMDMNCKCDDVADAYFLSCMW